MELIQELRRIVKGEIFDYQILQFCLRDYKKPRDKITQLLRNKSIIRLKKGIYAFGPAYRKGLLSLEITAAMLVQPSYISKEYALQYYGLLSERVERITSMTTRKKKHFDTPIGQFDYFSLSQKKFNIGVLAKNIPEVGGYLFATKEKAMADWISSFPMIQDKEALLFFLKEETRMDISSLLPFDQTLLNEIAMHYKNQNVSLLLSL